MDEMTIQEELDAAREKIAELRAELDATRDAEREELDAEREELRAEWEADQADRQLRDEAINAERAELEAIRATLDAERAELRARRVRLDAELEASRSGPAARQPWFTPEGSPAVRARAALQDALFHVQRDGELGLARVYARHVVDLLDGSPAVFRPLQATQLANVEARLDAIVGQANAAIQDCAAELQPGPLQHFEHVRDAARAALEELRSGAPAPAPRRQPPDHLERRLRDIIGQLGVIIEGAVLSKVTREHLALIQYDAEKARAEARGEDWR